MADLTTLDAVKAYAGVVGNADDTVLSQMISAYSALARQFMGRDITSQAYDVYRSGRGNAAMMLPQYPVTAVQLLQIDGQTIPAQTVWGQFGYRLTARSIVLDGCLFTFGRSNVRIQFTAGFATVPADIAQAVLEMVCLRYANRDHQGWSSKSLAGETVSLITKDMPDSARTVLQQYMNVVPA